MITVIVVGEGQTEETFVREMLAPALLARDLSLEARLIPTSTGARGGALRWDRVRLFLRNTLRERADTYVTTLFDLYGLQPDFPGVQQAEGARDPVERALVIEYELAAEVVREAGCQEDRFLAHIQPYEFEALLFSEVSRLAEVEPAWARSIQAFEKVRREVVSPEHINDGQMTHPSARLEALSPKYRKRLHGAQAATHIGLERIRQECAHFDSWVRRLEALQPL